MNVSRITLRWLSCRGGAFTTIHVDIAEPPRGAMPAPGVALLVTVTEGYGGHLVLFPGQHHESSMHMAASSSESTTRTVVVRVRLSVKITFCSFSFFCRQDPVKLPVLM